MSDAPPSLSVSSANHEDITEQVAAPKLPYKRNRKRRHRALRQHGPVLVLIGLLILGWVIYAIVWPTLEIRSKIANAKWKYHPNDPDISMPIRVVLRTCEYLYCFWFFYLGASIGSFINVVANRVPNGLTIVTRGSHCPYCDQRLSMIDNTPVFGWIALRGRCRTCHLPIASRYLIMEIVAGVIFMSLAVVELMGNGMNLPHHEWKHGSGIVSTVFYPKWNLIGTYITHASLFAVALMLIGSHMDRLRFPFFPLIIIGTIYIACATFQPLVAPVRWLEPWGPTYPQISNGLRFESFPWERFQTSILGLAAGTLIGLGFATLHWFTLLRPKIALNADFATGNPSGASRWFFHSVVISMLIGALLGWQVVFNVGILAYSMTILLLCLSSLGNWTGLAKDPVLRPQVLALAILTITLFLHHLFWRQLAFLPFLPFRPES